jgi:hypothetical protein
MCPPTELDLSLAIELSLGRPTRRTDEPAGAEVTAFVFQIKDAL